ncbi:MAG TPA: DNRLRE domain-containing protein [Planctomycetota bacterium]|nr:DNRLRE domain-containing protein [Planctomycetota bacterium]
MPQERDHDPGFLELASCFLDGVATDQEMEALDLSLRKDPQNLRTFAELLNQHGTLAWTQRGRESFSREAAALAPGAIGGHPPPSPRRGWWIAIPLAACLLLLIAIVRFRPEQVPSAPGEIASVKPPPTDPLSRTLSFQDGLSPSPDYRGARNVRLMDREPRESRGPEPYLEVDSSGEHPDRPVLLQWDLRAIPPGSRLSSVTLELVVTDASRDREAEAHALLRPWVESQANWMEYASGRHWESPGARGSRDRDTQVLARFKAARGAITIPFSEAGLGFVQRWVNSPDSNRGLLLQMAGPSGEFTFHGRGSSTPSARPKLTVTFYPRLDH